MELACKPPLGVEDVVHPSSLVIGGEHINPCFHKKESVKKYHCVFIKESVTENGWPLECDGDDNESKYYEIVGRSEGFDSFTDPTSTMSGSTRPWPLHDEVVTNAAKFAVEEHNKTTGANIILKKIVKANAQMQRGLMLYMTLETLDGDGDQTQLVFYEAKVLEDMYGVFEVNIFRKAIHYKDLKSNTGGYADSSTKGSAQRYQESGSENIFSKKRAFFDAHKDEEWLKSIYHPTNLLGVIETRNKCAQKYAKAYLLNLLEGMPDLNPGVTAFSPGKSGQTSEPNSDDEAADAGRKRRKHDKGQDEESDFSVALEAHLLSSEHTQIQSDIKQAHALVRKLDNEKGIKDNVLCDVHFLRSKFGSRSVFPVVAFQGFRAERVLYGNQLLRTLLTYLWCIHGVDYYGMSERYAPNFEWEKKLDSFWQKRLRRQDPLGATIGKEKIDAAENEALDQYVRKIDDDNNGCKYGCEAKGCTGILHCAECAREHLKLKHPELVMELTSKVHEDLYFHNYMSDPDTCGGTPDMQQP